LLTGAFFSIADVEAIRDFLNANHPGTQVLLSMILLLFFVLHWKALSLSF
jgi:hypothetical protein